MSTMSTISTFRKHFPVFTPKKYYRLKVYCILNHGELELLETITGVSPDNCMKDAIKTFGNGRTDLFWELPMEEVR